MPSCASAGGRERSVDGAVLADTLAIDDDRPSATGVRRGIAHARRRRFAMRGVLRDACAITGCACSSIVTPELVRDRATIVDISGSV